MVVSSTRFPPAPNLLVPVLVQGSKFCGIERVSTNAARPTKVARAIQLGDVPATMAKIEEEKREILKAKRRPMTSAPEEEKVSKSVKLAAVLEGLNLCAT